MVRVFQGYILVPVVNIFISYIRKDVGGHKFASVTKPMTLIEFGT